MDRIQLGLKEIATEMKLVLGDGYLEEDLYELVSSTYSSLKKQYGDQMQHMAPEAILQVLRRHMGELIRLKRTNKLLAKRRHIAPNQTE